MHFTPNEDQAALLSVFDQMAEGDAAVWKTSPAWERFEWSEAFDTVMEESGFYDCAKEDTLGLATAIAMIHRASRLPIAVECAASSTLRSLYAPDLPRPVAVIEGSPHHPTRFLPMARSAILIGDGVVRKAVLNANAVTPVESLFAFPMGVVAADAVEWQAMDVDPQLVLNTWRVAIAAEIGGALRGGLDSVVEHVKVRHQFGRPLGSFQVIQHRLAAAAGKIEGAYWLSLKAAQTLDPADCALALGYVQEASTKIVYDLHQFMGAMGLTLEHPLHRWTYRARLLRSSFGGAAANMQTVAATRWSAA